MPSIANLNNLLEVALFGKFMKPSILEKLQQLSDRLEEVTHLLGQPEATSDMDKGRK